MVRRLLVLGVVVTAVGLARAAAPAGACSCVAAPPEELVARADAVFVAVAVAGPVTVDPPAADGAAGADRVRSTLRVERVYRGDVGAVVEVVTARDGAACGVELAPGRHLVFAGRDDEGRLATGLCSGTRALAADEQPAGLGAGHEPAAAPAAPAPPTSAAPGGAVADPGLGPVATTVRWVAVAAVVVAAGVGAAALARGRRGRSRSLAGDGPA